MKSKFLVLGIAILCCTRAYAYKEEVHQRLTKRAFERADTANGFLARIGVKPTDIFGGRIPSRLAMDGAYDQDHRVLGLSCFNHFFDPVDLQPLRMPATEGCLRMGSTAPDWALGRASLNDYDLPHAKLYLARAILDANPGSREFHYREFFLSLGHMVHLIQDMAQPEHTRNDPHPPEPVPARWQAFLRAIGIDTDVHFGLYENWTFQHFGIEQDPITGQRVLLPDGTDPAAYFEGYPLVKLDEYDHYFSTGTGLGIAEYSNRNFVTQDTNYHDELNTRRCVRHPSPDYSATTVSHVQTIEEQVLDDFGRPYRIAVRETYLAAPVHDAYTGQTDTDRAHSILSILDHEARRYDPNGDGIPIYSLSDASYQTRAALLLPRAVGYSAGFLNHLFRGKIDAAFRPTGSGNWDMTVTNRGNEDIGADARIQAVFKATPAYFGRTNSDDTGFIFNDRIANRVADFNGLPPGGSVTILNIPISMLHNVDSLTDFERRIVMTGTLGVETDAVIPLVQGAPAVLVADLTVNCAIAKKQFAVSEYPIPTGTARFEDLLHLKIPSGTSRACTDPLMPAHPRRACIEKLSETAVRVTLNGFDPDRRYIFFIGASSDWLPDFGPNCSLLWEVRVDGKLVKTHTWVNPSGPAHGTHQSMFYP